MLKTPWRSVVKFLLVGHLLFFLFSASVMNLYAQEEPPPEAPPPDEKPPAVEVRALSPEQNRIDMDIRTSTLSELAAWCRSLGLPEGGTGADLAKRLREYFKIADQKQQDAQAAQGEDKRKIITIESARSTEYFRIEAVDEDYARLSGEVKISLKDGNSTHHIRAWNILFNRTRNILTATGGVEYIKGEGDKVETFRGESITVDLDNWSSVFMGGVSERSLQGDSTTYQFAGTVISRDEEEVIVLSKASIKSANNEESLWSLSATRVWLLPGSDFAIFNAVLKVGEIPVLYIPFFYYPADELIFHPVIGYRTREGNFVQTTTYIMGRPKANTATQSSLTKILGNSNDMEKKREGLYLRSTGKKAIDPNTTSLRAIVDYYSNLGTYIGTDLELPAKGILSALNLSLGIGVTRTVVQDGGNYTPYFPDYDGSSDWNSSSLFSKEVPFRYRLKTNSSIGGKYGSFSWTILYYSDPLVDSDFLNRAEEMDWVNMLQKGAAMEEDELAQNQLGSYTWQFSGQVNPNFSKMSPYINSITINNISSTVSFRTVDKKSSYLMTDIKYYSPSSFFYAPDTATLYSMSGTIAGTPLSFGGSAVSQTNSQTSETERPDPLKNIGVPRSPFEDKVKEDTKKKDQTDKLVPPELSQRFDLPRTGSIKTSLDYRIAPSGASTLKFNYNKWKEFNQIDWGDVSSILNNFSGDASTTVNVNHSENFFSNSFSYSGSGTWRQYGYLNEEAEEYLTAGVTDPAKVDNAKLQEYRSSSFSTSYNLSSTLRPLYQNPVFASSSLQYSLKGLAVKSKFDEKKSTADNPHWELEYGEWDRKKIDIHQATANLSALIMDKTQTLSFTADLPPKDSALAWRTGIRVWITETDANWRMRYPSKEEIQKGTDDRWKLEPFNATERLNFGAFGSFSQSLVLDTEGKELTSLTSALNFTKWGLTINYTASRMLGYEYIPKGSDKDNLAFEGWRTRKGEAKAGDPNYLLRSRDFSVNYSKNFSMKELWNNRLQFTVNTSSRLFFDLQRYTNSNFTFTLGFTLGINKFLDLSLSTSSENVSIYRYFRNMPFFSDAPIVIPDGPQNNLFFDLLNSFRFDDDKLRESSGFKMKNFRAAATHYMGDWNAILSWTMSPYRPVNKRQYEINNEVSFLLQWMPINEIKTDVSYNKSKTPEWTVK